VDRIHLSGGILKYNGMRREKVNFEVAPCMPGGGLSGELGGIASLERPAFLAVLGKSQRAVEGAVSESSRAAKAAGGDYRTTRSEEGRWLVVTVDPVSGGALEIVFASRSCAKKSPDQKRNRERASRRPLFLSRP